MVNLLAADSGDNSETSLSVCTFSLFLIRKMSQGKRLNVSILGGGCRCASLLVSILFPKVLFTSWPVQKQFEKGIHCFQKYIKGISLHPTFICTLHYFFALPDLLYFCLSASLPSPLSDKKDLCLCCPQALGK